MLPLSVLGVQASVRLGMNLHYLSRLSPSPTLEDLPCSKEMRTLRRTAEAHPLAHKHHAHRGWYAADLRHSPKLPPHPMLSPHALTKMPLPNHPMLSPHTLIPCFYDPRAVRVCQWHKLRGVYPPIKPAHLCPPGTQLSAHHGLRSGEIAIDERPNNMASDWPAAAGV